MRLYIVVVRDACAQVFGQPQFVPNVGAAVRAFGDQVKNPEKGNVLHEHPEHFAMYKLGVYEDGDAKMQLLDVPEQLALASDYI